LRFRSRFWHWTSYSYFISTAGAKVIVSDINEKGAAETVSALKANGGEATFVKADVSDAAACEALVKQTIKRYGKLDIASNNAGIGGEMNTVADMSIEASFVTGNYYAIDGGYLAV